MWINILLYAFLAVLFHAHTGLCQTQPDILLQQSDMPGYILKQQRPFFLGISEGKIQETIYQTWIREGDETNFIYINYGIFSSSEDAFRGILYYKGSLAAPFLIGTFGGYMIGDKSWFPNVTGIIILRANIGIQISKMSDTPPTESDFGIVEQKSRIILNKIENSLSSEVRNSEEEKKASQISSARYQNIIESAAGSEYMKSYSLFSSWDSKWFTDTGGFVLGRRTEWKDERGGIIGIDIAEFESPDLANEAKEVRISEVELPHTIHPISTFEIGSPASVDSLVERWKSALFPHIPISGISTKGRIAIHIYHSAPYGNDTETFSKVLKEVSNKISF